MRDLHRIGCVRCGLNRPPSKPVVGLYSKLVPLLLTELSSADVDWSSQCQCVSIGADPVLMICDDRRVMYGLWIDRLVCDW